MPFVKYQLPGPSSAKAADGCNRTISLLSLAFARDALSEPTVLSNLLHGRNPVAFLPTPPSVRVLPAKIANQKHPQGVFRICALPKSDLNLPPEDRLSGSERSSVGAP